MKPEAQAELLLKTMKEFNKENATSEDVTKLFTKALEAVDAVKKQLEAKITQNDGKITDRTQSLMDDISSLKDNVKAFGSLLSKNEGKTTKEIDDVLKKVFKEVKRVESLIPDMPDVQPIIQRVEEVSKKTISATDVRDKLESLKGEDRLDNSAVQDVPKITVSEKAPPDPKYGDIWIKTA